MRSRSSGRGAADAGRVFARVVTPLVALAAGALLGGALFHMLPESIAATGNDLAVYGWVAAGVVFFHLLEQFLHWHHCHRPVSAHRPLGYLILAADGLHNLIGGLAVGSAFVVDIRLGIITWLVAPPTRSRRSSVTSASWCTAAGHRSSALIYNLVSALSFPVGGLIAYGFSGRIDAVVLLPFAAGTFIYIALADLLPETTAAPDTSQKVIHTLSFVAGLSLLGLLAAAI